MKKRALLFLLAFVLGASVFGVTLVKDGVACAEIVLHERSYPIERFAAEELNYHLKRITGAELPIVNRATGKPAVYLGKVAGIPQRALVENSCVVRIAGDTIAIAGGDGIGEALNVETAAGTLFGIYDLLEKKLGVRWLWPGESGVKVPHQATVEFADEEWTVEPPLRAAGWRQMMNYGIWKDKKNAEAFIANELLWLRRLRFSSIDHYGYGHAYIKYWELYSKEHPEYFNQLPDGTRRPDDCPPDFISMCVSNEGFVKRVIKNWQKEDPHGLINANENDTAGRCTCDACMAADESDDPDRFARAKAVFERRSGGWQVQLGSLSDRYAKFYLALLKEGEKYNPNCRVIGLIYANYYLPPKHTMLNDRVILRFCPPIMYPWTPDKVEAFKSMWKGWTDCGVQLMLRPNFTLDGHNFPLVYYRDFAECFDFAFPRKMVAVDMDSLTGMYGVNGLTTYVIASQVGSCGKKSVEELEEDYFSAFGAAKDVMRKYMKVLEDATHSFEHTANPADIVGGNYTRFYTWAGKIFTPEVYEKAFALLEEAKSLTAKDWEAYDRVNFVWTGLMDSKLTLDTWAAHEKFQKTKDEADRKARGRAYRKMEEFRFAHEHLGYANFTWSRGCEGGWGAWRAE